jgi:Carboxypeptidase regulatory-like domain
MKLHHFSRWRLSVLALVFLNYAAAQSLITGGIAGTVTDPAAAVVPNATVTLLSLDSGEIQADTTNGDGVYSFTQLKPGHYQVTVTVPSFAKMVTTASVEVGQTNLINVTLEISKGVETIEVITGAPLISTDPGVSTSYTPTEVSLLPAAGGDITTLAFTAPGVIVTTGGIGNFSVNGLPGTSNLFTVNGENDMDPYFNVNASGASNLTLGQNEVQEATVVTNAYSGEYGQLSGAQVSYVTKSGTNAFHGNAQWYWNGRVMNSNDFFFNATGTPRPFSNANQWAASVGGPVFKDHTWFFVDTEGLRFILPNAFVVTIPTPAFASAVLANVQNLNPNEATAYQTMFNLYSTAASGKVATPLSPANTECANVVVPGFATGSPCAETIVTSPTSFGTDWILAGRIDQKLTSKDDLFFRFKLNYGLQPSYIDPISPAFDANSNQPSWDYQANLRHVFNSSATNSFTGTVSHYTAQFVQDIPKWQAAFPDGSVAFNFTDGFTSINGPLYYFPQGRNITQYQFIDDFSWVFGKHSFKFGLNFRRYDVSDHNFFGIYPTTTFGDLSSGAGMLGIQAFADGVAETYTQAYSPKTDVPIALWGLGFYVEDQWKVTSNFSLMGALRFEKNANPVCNINCFTNFNAPFYDLPSIKAGYAGAADVPYSSDISTGLHNAYMGVDAINPSPRLSFSWAPGASNRFPHFPGGGKTVISGGVGIFYDNPPAGAVDNLLANPPDAVLFNITPLDSDGNPIGILPFDSSAPNGGPAAFKAASAAFNINKSYNQLSQILDPIIGYNPPINFTSIQGTIHSPQVQEWNLKVGQEITKSTAVSVNYVGNHSVHILYYDSWWNAYAVSGGAYSEIPGIASQAYPNYAGVTTIQSGAVSNYNGVQLSLRVQHQNWIMAHINYTYSHALDETSNGGLFGIGVNSYQTQINPGSLRANNYGNADYDIRNSFNADYVITPPVHFQNRFARAALDGWQWSGKAYARSGFPFTVFDNNAASDFVYGGSNIAQVIAPGASSSCGSGAAYTNATVKPCLNASAFLNSTTTYYTTFPTQTRNQFRGPDYIDFDMGLFKTFQVKERLTFGLGAMAFNVFNHPNFNLPDNGVGDPLFGQITSMQGVPASPYGNGLGYDSSVRTVQLSLKMTF